MTRLPPVEVQRSRLHETVEAVRDRCDLEPRVALILGTGLGGLAGQVEVTESIPFGDLPHFPVSTVDSHAGRLLLGRLAGTPVVAMQGRPHRYEGYSLQDVTFPVRVMRRLGAGVLVGTGACGGMNPLWGPGDLVLLDDHINLLGDSPLVGPNDPEQGARFPDMSEPYDRELQGMARTVALEAGLPLRVGVYAAVPGPNLETRAEYRMLRAMGADVVGMSTVPEVIVARQMGMRVLALSIITDACLPDALEPADITEIIRTAREAEPNLAHVVKTVVGLL